MIKFESEKCFENMLFDHVRETMVDPIHHEKIIYGQTQPNFGAHGIGDIILTTEFPLAGKDNTIYRSIHLIELKVQPLITSHISQLCRYKDFIDSSNLAARVGAKDVRYSLINPYSNIPYDTQCLANACGVDIYYYEMSMSGVVFNNYDTEIDDSEIESIAEKLTAKLSKNDEGK